MTKKLEELFNLADTDPETDVALPVEHQEVMDIERSYKEAEAIAATLPTITELNNLDEQELDALATKAEQAYDDLMDLGMNVEPRYSSRIFEVAQSALKNAIDAKSAKIDKKLKMIELQLKKAKLDQDAQGKDPDGAGAIHGEGVLITDRNSLLEKLRNIK